MSHYRSNVRDLEFNLFEVLGAGDVMGVGPFLFRKFSQVFYPLSPSPMQSSGKRFTTVLFCTAL